MLLVRFRKLSFIHPECLLLMHQLLIKVPMAVNHIFQHPHIIHKGLCEMFDTLLYGKHTEGHHIILLTEGDTPIPKFIHRHFGCFLQYVLIVIILV